MLRRMALSPFFPFGAFAVGDSPAAAIALAERSSVAGISRLEERGKLGSGVRIGILLEPDPSGVDHTHHSSPMTRASNAEITGSAALPASMTSWWLSGVVWMPAAMFVMSENPRISIPA